MNKACLVKIVSIECDLHEDVVKEVFDSIFSNISEHVLDKQSFVTIPNFGKFHPFTNKDGSPRMEFTLSNSLKKLYKPKPPVEDFEYIKYTKW